MLDEKQWWQSRGMVGSLVSILTGIALLAGYAVSPEDQATLVELIFGITSSVGGLLGWFGRLWATKRINRGNTGVGLVNFAAAAIVVTLIIGCAGVAKPQTTEEWIEALELSARQAQISVVNLTCTDFAAGECIDPNAILDPDQAIRLHDKLADARKGIRAATSFVDVGEGLCLGEVRTVDGCLTEVSIMITEVKGALR